MLPQPVRTVQSMPRDKRARCLLMPAGLHWQCAQLPPRMRRQLRMLAESGLYQYEMRGPVHRGLRPKCPLPSG